MTPAPAPKPLAPSPVEEKLRAVHPDEMTAREALNLLYELKAELS
jgi:DNA mismatch repair protein MutS